MKTQQIKWILCPRTKWGRAVTERQCKKCKRKPLDCPVRGKK
jgi:hypothetical protein